MQLFFLITPTLFHLEEDSGLNFLKSKVFVNIWFEEDSSIFLSLSLSVMLYCSSSDMAMAFFNISSSSSLAKFGISEDASWTTSSEKIFHFNKYFYIL